ncbi:GIY-YIG nuclease family protein [Streptomyces reniochalinae]|uniref:GIY-YIG nuclease family protein n=1 Tax=Streptomyces reniochalinae TaxID=2250578 RepID=UPI0015F0BA3E|nr:GIY-YIG nuclease family protein [Streptomyces reniochalinae]
MTTVFKAGRTALYRFYDGKGRLLYVGVSSQLERRWAQHEMSKPWWHLVERRTVEWHATGREALAAEEQAINSEAPLYQLTSDQYDCETEIDYATTRLRADLAAGRFPTGYRFVYKELAPVYGVASATVGFALDVLYREGLVSRSSNRYVAA